MRVDRLYDVVLYADNRSLAAVMRSRGTLKCIKYVVCFHVMLDLDGDVFLEYFGNKA